MEDANTKAAVRLTIKDLAEYILIGLMFVAMAVLHGLFISVIILLMFHLH